MDQLKNKKSIFRLFATGLLITAATQLLSHYVNLPDLVNGGLLGVGIGIEILALIHLKRWKNAKLQSAPVTGNRNQGNKHI